MVVLEERQQSAAGVDCGINAGIIGTGVVLNVKGWLTATNTIKAFCQRSLWIVPAACGFYHKHL